jgi:hypothetical protein
VAAVGDIRIAVRIWVCDHADVGSYTILDRQAERIAELKK